MTYREINFRVMTDTAEQCETQPALAIRNPAYTVAMTFLELLQHYHCFEAIEFAIGDKYGKNYVAFEKALKKK